MIAPTETVILRAQFGNIEKRQHLTGPRYPKLKKRHPQMALAIKVLFARWEKEMGCKPNITQVFPFSV